MTAPAHTPLRQPRIRKISASSSGSASRQLLFELERALSNITIHETEAQKVGAFNRRSYYEGLEARELERTQADIAALDAATARHEAIRQQAEAELLRHRRELEEAERRRKEEEARMAKEKAAREKAEQERREREEAERQAKIEREKAAAAAKKAAEQKAKADAEAAARKEREEAAARAKADQDRQTQEAAAKQKADQAAADQKAAQEAAAAASAAAQKSASSAQAAQSSGALTAKLLEQHNRYLEIHKKLKQFRKDFTAMVKTNPELKAHVGDMRRGTKTSVGQLTDEKAANKKAHDRIKTFLASSLTQISSPPITISDYLPTPIADPSTTFPSLTLYLLSIFSKAIVSAFAGECAVNARAAEPIGTLAAQIFSQADLQIALLNPQNLSPPPTTSLISILISKYHAAAPHLFGIALPTNTAANRVKMGWRRDFESSDPSNQNKSFVTESRQLDRLAGLGAGYASIALRNFSRTKMKNPYPPRCFWESMACVMNAPVQNVETGHLVLVKAMLEVGWERIVLFWGSNGVAALREVTIDWPARLPPTLRDGPVAKGLMFMADTWAREKHFDIKV